MSNSNLVMRIWGKEVCFDTEQINNVCGFPNIDMRDCEVKDYASGSWLVEKVCPGREVPWTATKTRIILNEFTVEARISLTVIYSCGSLSTNMTYIPFMRANMVACLLYNIPFNVGQFVFSKIRHFKNKSGLMLMFPSLIIEL